MSAKHKLRQERDEAIEAELRIRRILMMPGFERDRLLLQARDILDEWRRAQFAAPAPLSEILRLIRRIDEGEE